MVLPAASTRLVLVAGMSGKVLPLALMLSAIYVTMEITEDGCHVISKWRMVGRKNCVHSLFFLCSICRYYATLV